jgi:site-specific recombinase XerD
MMKHGFNTNSPPSRIYGATRRCHHASSHYQHVPKNIALKLPYPKIEKTVPQFLTIHEFKLLIRHFRIQKKDQVAPS